MSLPYSKDNKQRLISSLSSICSVTENVLLASNNAKNISVGVNTEIHCSTKFYGLMDKFLLSLHVIYLFIVTEITYTVNQQVLKICLHQFFSLMRDSFICEDYF